MSIAAILQTGELLTIIAGGGSVPLIVASAAARAGRPVLIIGIEGEADKEIAAFPHRWFSWGQVGRLLRLLKDNRAQELVLVGKVAKRPDYRRLRLDFGAVRQLPTILRIVSGGDAQVLSGTVKFLESKGYRVIGPHEVARELVADSGVLTRARPSAGDIRDADLAHRAARTIGELDVGQAAVAVGGRVIALEGAEGTDAMLARVAELRRSGRVQWQGRAGVLVKCPKPQQDLRVDMPTIGPGTVENVAAAGLAGIAIEPGRVMLAERQAMVDAADEHGVFVVAREQPEGGRP